MLRTKKESDSTGKENTKINQLLSKELNQNHFTCVLEQLLNVTI